MMNSSSLMDPLLTLLLIEVRYSWIFSMTFSVASPDRIWSRTYLDDDDNFVRNRITAGSG